MNVSDVSVGNLKRQQGGPDLPGPTPAQTETSRTFTMTVLRTSRLDASTQTDIFDPFLYSLNDPAIGDNSAVRFVGGRGIDVFSNDATRIDIASNAPTTEYLDVLNTIPLGTNGNVDNIIISSAETDINGNPESSSTLQIPVVDGMRFNAQDENDVLVLTRNGRDDLTVTLGNAASRGTTDTFSATTGGELLPTVAAVREDDLGLQREIEAAVVNQKLEDHHGVQPVYTHGGQTPIPEAHRDTDSENAELDRRQDNRLFRTEETLSALEFRTAGGTIDAPGSGALILHLLGDANASSWTVGNVINRTFNTNNVDWRGVVAYSGTDAATVTLNGSDTIDVPSSGTGTYRVVINIDIEYWDRFRNRPNVWLQSGPGNTIDNVQETTRQYFFIIIGSTNEGDVWLVNTNVVVDHVNLDNVVYVRNADQSNGFEWDAVDIGDFNQHGFDFQQTAIPPTQRSTSTSLQEGDRWRDTDTGRLYVWNVNDQGSMWVQSGGVGQITTDFSGYPTINAPLPTVEDQPIIYFTGDAANAEGLYRWSGTAYLPGPRVLDFRHTDTGGTTTTVAEDVDSATFSSDYTVSAEGAIGLANPFTPEENILRILTNLPTQDTTITRSQDGGEDIVYWIEIDSNIHVNNDITIQLRGSNVQSLTKVDGINNHLGAGDNRFTFTLTAAPITGWNNNANLPADQQDFQGFGVFNGATSIEGIRDDNQFFLGASATASHPTPANDSVGIAQLDFADGAQQIPDRIIVTDTNNQLQTIVDPSTQVLDNHSDILENENQITRIQSSVDTLQNAVHRLEATQTAQRFNTHVFRTAALRSSTIDELISYTPTDGTATNWAYDSDTDTGITLEEWAFTGGCLLYTSPSPRDS